MESEWLDVAYINFDKVILHGQVVREFMCEPRREIEQILTEEQKNALYDLNAKQAQEMKQLLRSFVNG